MHRPVIMVVRVLQVSLFKIVFPSTLPLSSSFLFQYRRDGRGPVCSRGRVLPLSTPASAAVRDRTRPTAVFSSFDMKENILQSVPGQPELNFGVRIVKK